MKVLAQMLVFLLTVISFSHAENLISFNEIETLFTKLMQHQLTPKDNATLKDVFEIFRRPEPNSVEPQPSDRSGHFRRKIECLLCQGIASAFITCVSSGRTDEEIGITVTVLCTGLGLFSYEVCRGAVALNVPILAYIVRTTPEVSARTFCGLILQTESDPQACPYDDDPRFEYEVQLPEKPSKEIPVTHNGKPLKVAIITDAHIEPLYEASGVAECNEPTCCRKGQTPAKKKPFRSAVNHSVLEKSVFNANDTLMVDINKAKQVPNLILNVWDLSTKLFHRPKPAGYWGDYRNCDSPIRAFDDVIVTIKENHGDIDLLYYIGDTIDHGIWATSYETINKMHKYLIDKIRFTFGDKVQLVPVIGNHESQPVNQFAPASITAPKLNTTWLYSSLADKWENYLTDDAQATLRAGGDFSLVVKPGLRIISLNNNVASRFNWWINYDPSDGKKHLDWLVQELYSAEQKGEKVHILAHVPPGTVDLTFTWTREYNKIVNRFSSTIAAEFNAHTHTDEFRIFYSPEGNPINVAWGGGGLSTYSFYNVNYKIVNLHPQTYVPVSMHNYIYNLTEANLTPNERPRWFLLYDMNSSFGVTDLSPKSMGDLLYSMVTDRRHLLDLYAKFNSKNSDVLWPKCNKTCKLDLVCITATTVLWDRRKCEELIKLFDS